VGVYDWLVSFARLEPLLERFLSNDPTPGAANDVCVVGCGTSTLSEELVRAPWFEGSSGSGARRVVSCDYDDGVTAHMRARALAQPVGQLLAYETADMSVVPAEHAADEGGGGGGGDSPTSLLRPGAFGSVVDKGTLDAMLCEGLGGGGSSGGDSGGGSSASASAALCTNAARLLAPGGRCFVLDAHTTCDTCRLHPLLPRHAVGAIAYSVKLCHCQSFYNQPLPPPHRPGTSS